MRRCVVHVVYILDTVRLVRSVGVDIGGASVRAARLSPGNRLEARASAPVGSGMSSERLLAEIIAVTTRVLVPGRPSERRIGVAIPAFLGQDRRVHYSLNLPGLEGIKLEDELTRALGGPSVTVMPDIAAAALAEAGAGAGSGHRRVLCAALGTGANAALIVDGKLVETAHGALGDAGHVLTEPGGPECVCGGRGCLEAIAGGAALRREACPRAG